MLTVVTAAPAHATATFTATFSPLSWNGSDYQDQHLGSPSGPVVIVADTSTVLTMVTSDGVTLTGINGTANIHVVLFTGHSGPGANHHVTLYIADGALTGQGQSEDAAGAQAWLRSIGGDGTITVDNFKANAFTAHGNSDYTWNGFGGFDQAGAVTVVSGRTSPPAITHSSGLNSSNAALSVSNNQTSATGVHDTFQYTTGSSGTIADLMFTLPLDTTGTPTVVSNYGIGAGTVSLGTDTNFAFIDYTVTTPASIPSGTPILIEIGGLTNTATPQSWSALYLSMDGSSTPIDGPVTVDSPAIVYGNSNTVVTVVVAKSLTFTNDTSSFILLMDPALSALADESKDVTLTVRTNASSGYTLQANDTAAGLNTGSDTIARFSSNGQTGHAAWGATVDKYGYTITPTISGTAALTGAMAGGDYAGYSNTPETLVSRSDPTGNTPDQLVITNRVKIDYAQDAGTYGDTLTYTVTPSY